MINIRYFFKKYLHSLELSNRRIYGESIRCEIYEDIKNVLNPIQGIIMDELEDKLNEKYHK